MPTTARFEAQSQQNNIRLAFHYEMPVHELQTGLFAREPVITKPIPHAVFFDVLSGTYMKETQRRCFLDLNPFEVQSGNTFRGIDGQYPSWYIVGIDARNGDIFHAGGSNAYRNEVVNVQIKLNMVLELALELSKPFEATIRSNYRNGLTAPEADADVEIETDILAHWEKLKPDWDW